MTEIINWKEVIEKANQTQRLAKCRIQAQTKEAREVFDYTVPDAIAYMNPRFRANVLTAVVRKANDIFEQLALAQPRFKGKCSLCCHSLGTVISYDILRR